MPSDPFQRVTLVDPQRLKDINEELMNFVLTAAELKILLAEVDAEIAKTSTMSAATALIETLHFTKGRITGLLQAMGVIL